MEYVIALEQNLCGRFVHRHQNGRYALLSRRNGYRSEAGEPTSIFLHRNPDFTSNNMSKRK